MNLFPVCFVTFLTSHNHRQLAKLPFFGLMCINKLMDGMSWVGDTRAGKELMKQVLITSTELQLAKCQD
jgi:hypothetical protein